MSNYILMILISISVSVKPIMLPMHATAYCLTGTTASGTQTRYGVCATGIRALLGNEAIIYQRLPDGSKGKYIGTYIIEDTGCSDHVIDVWKPNITECQEFMDLVYENDCRGQIWVELRRID